MINANRLLCPNCDIPLPHQAMNVDGPAHCPACNRKVLATVFPALARPPKKSDSGQRIMMDSETSCFYHPNKKAVTPCSSCGRFLCALCDIDMQDNHICPRCLEKGAEKGRMQSLETTRTRHDQIALSLALAPLLIFWLTLITAPAALYYVIRHWRSPQSIVSRSRTILIVAGAFATLQIGGWITFFIYLGTK